MARVAIVGVGAIGGVLAALLQRTGSHEITLCTRRPLPVLSVDTPSGTVAVAARNLTDPAQADVQDWVLVATKTYDARSAAAWFPKLCNPRTRVAIVQNGVEHRENFAPYLPPDRILPVIIDCPAERRPDNTVLQRGPATMRLEDSADGADFRSLFHAPDLTVELTDDLRTAAWQKLCLNAAGVISALTLHPAGILRDQALGDVALGIVAECVAVGRAEGARLDDGIGDRILAGARSGPPDSVNSILADRIAGRPMEVDARNGVIVRLGQRHGIPTPLNSMAVALLNAPAITRWPEPKH